MKRRIFLVALFLAVGALPALALNLFQDSFDDNVAKLSGWKRSSTTYVTRYTGTPKVGDASLRFAGSGNAITYVKVTPFTGMTLSFKMAQSGLTSSEYVRCQYWNGTSWVTLRTLYGGGTANSFTSYSGIAIPNMAVLQIRFIVYATATTKYGFVDDVVLSGVRK